MTDFEFPNDTERVAIVGRTGSGKTQFGSWLLSNADFHAKPWVVVDFKGDELLNSIAHARHIDTGDKLPKKPGLFILHAHPDDSDGIEQKMMQVWAQEHTGLCIDEGYMVDPKSRGLQAILTQGRSKHIPAIVLSQRPSWLSKFVFTEADYLSVFHLNAKDDRKKIGEFMPPDIDLGLNPPRFHSHWYDVKRNHIFMMQPVPERDRILERFNARLTPKRSFFI